MKRLFVVLTAVILAAIATSATAQISIVIDSGNRDASSANDITVSAAMTPLRANARMALGPAVAKATPARARMPPPTMPPTPTPVAGSSPRVLPALFFESRLCAVMDGG